MRKSGGLADSPLFSTPTRKLDVPDSQAPDQISLNQSKPISKTRKEKPPDTNLSPNHDAATPNNRDTMTPWYHATIIGKVRKAVKILGKEAATHRFTIEEKKAVANIIYTYKTQGVKTSENEIARIAINFVLEDYKENGENSILEKALKALNE